MKSALSRAWWPLAGMTLGGLAGVVLAVASGMVSPLVALVIPLALGGVVAVLACPGLGLLLTAAVIPIEKLGRFGDDLEHKAFSLMRLVGLLALVSVLLHLALRRWRWRCPPPVLLYTGYYLVCVASYFYANNPDWVQGQLGTNLGNLLFLVLLVNGVRDWRMIRILMLTWLSVTVAIGLYQVYDWHFGNPISELDLGKSSTRFGMVNDSLSEQATIGNVLRAVGTSSTPAAFGINVMITLPFFSYLFRQAGSRPIQVLLLSCILLMLYNMILTNTRGVMLVGALMVGACILTGLLRVTLVRAAFLALLSVLLLLITPADVWERSLDPTNYTAEKSDNIRARYALWDAAFRIGMEHWATGIGVGDFTTIIEYVKGLNIDAEWVSAHNEYLNTFLEVGLFGWLLFFGCVFATLRYAVRAARLYRQLGEEDHYWFAIACVLTTVLVLIFALQVDVFHFPLKGWWLVAGFSWVIYVLAEERREVLRTEARVRG